MKRLIMTAVMLCGITMGYAQQLGLDSVKAGAKSDFFKLDNLSLQLQGGTQGVGMNFRYNFFPALAARFGGSFGSVTINRGFTFDNLATRNSIEARFANVHLLAEASPLKWLRVVGGIGRIFEAEGRANMTPTESFTQEGITLEPEELGVLTANVSYKKLAPYFGLGFGKGLPNKRFNVNMDVGVYRLSAPSVTVTGTEYLSDNAHNGPIIAQNMKDYRWMPVVQLNFNFRVLNNK
ncbi:MAG: hypothetical protein EOO92_06210 [Pedobacter sp.]|nr:MAG: hypothetical protein EOO92_06210 [Pedobacter sp.]